ncbi:alkaline-phosphatase-like protein [Boeremia exigua]|uniref:alkaline-phosphatase-like protein n=1 Tax=Boeremia exigua TaxID=749465 RepID=UPI001E8DB68A|nr:alkaline-phosphatase-like protein [Boeremia exigua]KAH6633325.1 alkaline-phosphatase-like protein [Boeremia exigua]
MAPGAVRSESPAAYSHPIKQSRQVDSKLQVHTATDSHVSLKDSTITNGHVNGSNARGANNHPTRSQDGRDVVTSEFLLEQSQKIASGNGRRSSRKPNILYIMADQMTASLLKMNNADSVVQTPNLDKLAETGVVFSSAYCNSPLCAPSRFTMCTGQLPSKIAGYDNASILAPEVPTYAHYLRAEGYETALAGKMHFIGPDQLHGFEHRLTTDIYPADLGWSVNWDKPEERQEWFHNMSSVLQAGPTVRTNQLDYDEEVMFKSSQYLHEWVREPAATRRPFALTVSLTHPHDPYAMLRKYWDLYEGVDIPLPEVEIPQDEQDPHSQRIMKCIDLWDNPVPDEAKLRARRAYFAECSFVDDQVGKLMQILKDSYLDDDTIIVFSGDHGDMLGERGLWYKMSWFENSARVPMVINYPSKFKPKRVSESVSTMDLLPTFVDLAGGDASSILPIDGTSLFDYLVSDKPGKDEVFGEYMGESTVTPTYMIRRHQWKYTCSMVDPPQLFDLSNDPKELNNLALSDKPQHEEVLNKFEAEARAKWNFQQIHQDALKSQRYRRICWKALQLGRKEHWDYEPPASGRDKFIRSHIPLDDLELRARFPVVDSLGHEQVANATHHGAAGACGE